MIMYKSVYLLGKYLKLKKFVEKSYTLSVLPHNARLFRNRLTFFLALNNWILLFRKVR